MSTPPSADRVRRHREIRSLVKRRALSSQDELVEALTERGFPVTQATLSRDLKELRILRVPTDQGYRYAEAGASADASGAGRVGEPGSSEARRLQDVASLEVTGIDGNETCVVVRTLTGRAQGVAAWLDGLVIPDILATIAGDDTILVVPKSVKRNARLRAALAGVLGLTGASRAEPSR
jgi:transcriptional regulator of arginine metabolism